MRSEYTANLDLALRPVARPIRRVKPAPTRNWAATLTRLPVVAVRTLFR